MAPVVTMTAPQITCPPRALRPPDGGQERDGSPVVVRPVRRPLAVDCDRQPVAAQLVLSVQFYLDVERC